MYDNLNDVFGRLLADVAVTMLGDVKKTEVWDVGIGMIAGRLYDEVEG